MSAAPEFPLKARLASMNERTQALLRYHFDHHDQPRFTLAASTDEPDVLIIDFDHPGTRDGIVSGRWQDARAVMVLAYGEPPIDNAVVVKKPLDRNRLDAAAQQLVHEFSGSPCTVRLQVGDDELLADDVTAAVTRHPTRGRSATGKTGDDTGALPHDGRQTASQEVVRYQAKLTRLCGRQRSLDDFAAGDDPVHRYDPRHYLSHTVAQVLAEPEAASRTVRLTLFETDIYLMPMLNRIYMTDSLKLAANVEQLFRPLESGEVDIQSYGGSETGRLLERLNGRARYSYSVQAFCWLAGLFAGHGRLPVGLDLEQPLQLRRWPNFTRLELIPECMNIAAAWTTRTCSIRDMVERTGCEPRYVSAFCNGAMALGLVVERAATQPVDT